MDKWGNDIGVTVSGIGAQTIAYGGAFGVSEPTEAMAVAECLRRAETRIADLEEAVRRLQEVVQP